LVITSGKQHLRNHLNSFYAPQYYSVFLLFEKHTVKKTLVVRSGYFGISSSKYKALKGVEEEFSYSEVRSQNQSVGDSDPPLSC
jgi:hypothetical protein